MRFRHLLFFISAITLSGCFAAYIPEPQLDYQSSPSESAIIAFSVSSLAGIEEKSGWSRLNGSNSLGHQYIFPGLPITRLYLERDLNDVLGEYLLYHPKLGRGARAITDLSPSELRQLFGAKTKLFKLGIDRFSTSAQDFFFLRKAIVEGRINFFLNNSNPVQLEFSSSRFISKGTVEVLSELIEESLFNSFESSNITDYAAKVTNEILPITTLVCLSQKLNLEDRSCLSSKNISIGVENYFRKKNLHFVSFRDACPRTLPAQSLLLSIETSEITKENDLLKISGNFSLADLANGNKKIRSLELSNSAQPDYSSNEPDCAGMRQLSEKLLEEFFQNG